MKVLFVVNAAVVDPVLLQEYRAAAVPTLARHGARLLASSNEAEIIEGTPFGTRVVVVEFPDRESFDAWYSDPEYAEVMQMRLQATTGAALLVEGRE